MTGARAVAFRKNLIAWFHEHGRDLPWRRTHDLYAVLISEFMLQQTQVSTVIPYFERWMRRFPDFAALAEAPEQEVMRHWEGLGYYSRARNLHRLAAVVSTTHGGALPVGLAELRALPGIGDYTAAAVTAFAHDRPAPVVDANIARVLARIADYRERIDSGGGKRFLQDAALTLQPRENARVFNSALMELGALICRSGDPKCPECPVRRFCAATEPRSLPVKGARATVTRRTERVAFVASDEKLYLSPCEGPRWRGLWRLPDVARTRSKPAAVIEYPITRYRVTMEVVTGCPEDFTGLRGFSFSEIDRVPMPAPHRRAVEKLAVLRAASGTDL